MTAEERQKLRTQAEMLLQEGDIRNVQLLPRRAIELLDALGEAEQRADENYASYERIKELYSQAMNNLATLRAELDARTAEVEKLREEVLRARYLLDQTQRLWIGSEEDELNHEIEEFLKVNP